MPGNTRTRRGKRENFDAFLCGGIRRTSKKCRTGKNSSKVYEYKYTGM
jgi:hypothetical protein